MRYGILMDPALLKHIVSDLLATLGFEGHTLEVKTGHPASPKTPSRGGRTLVSIVTPDSKELIGPHGEHLRAINSVARRLVEAKYGEEASNFLIDVNGYHEEKMEGVRANARMLAQRARLFIGSAGDSRC